MLHSALGEILSQLYLVHPQSELSSSLVGLKCPPPLF